MTTSDRDSSIHSVDSSSPHGDDCPCPTADSGSIAQPKPRGRFSRRKFLRTLIFGGVAALAVDSWLIEPQWVEYPERPLTITNLPPPLHGMRIAHLTDMHLSDLSPLDYQRKVVHHVNRLKVDLVAVTGDLITNDEQFIKPVSQLLGDLEAPVVVIFGNHDYYPIKPTPGPSLDQIMEKELIRQGCRVLRNRALPIERNGGRIWVAGMEDLLMGEFNPQMAFAGLPAGEPVVALSHNPDTIYDLLPFKPSVMLAGHTHGGQICLPFVTRFILPIQHKQFQSGLFHLDATKMYVSRGVGCRRLGLRFRCRPEVPIHVLQPTPA